MGAGQDSTETSLGWAFAILCNHPEVQTKMQEEIDGFIKINGRSPVFDDRDALPYLLSTIKECLRFRPPTSFGAPHIISKDVEVNGYFIPEGTTVVTTMESLHFNESVYENADKFMPERFLDNTKTMTSSANGRIAERDHYNFGWGRRICPGIYMVSGFLFSLLMNNFINVPFFLLFRLKSNYFVCLSSFLEDVLLNLLEILMAIRSTLILIQWRTLVLSLLQDHTKLNSPRDPTLYYNTFIL
jgi:hypothetical protein